MKITTCLVGSFSSGKSTLLKRYILKNEFKDSKMQPTIGMSGVEKHTVVDTTQIRNIIFDTAGQERYDSLCPMYYRNAACAVIVYDVTDRESLAKANHWLTTLHKDFPDTSLILVGNKIDLQESRVIQYEYAHEIAQDFMAGFYEVSGKSGEGLDVFFRRIGNIVRSKMDSHVIQISKLHKDKPERDWCYLHFNKCC